MMGHLVKGQHVVPVFPVDVWALEDLDHKNWKILTISEIPFLDGKAEVVFCCPFLERQARQLAPIGICELDLEHVLHKEAPADGLELEGAAVRVEWDIEAAHAPVGGEEEGGGARVVD